MLVQFHVVVINRRPIELPTDGGAVHQSPGADQHAVHEDGVVRRDQQIAVRHVVSEGGAFDADRRHGLRPRMAGEAYAAMAEPLDGLRDFFANDQSDDLHAGTQRLDRQFPVRGSDHRPAHVADSAEKNVGAGPGFVRHGEHTPAPGAIGDAGQIQDRTVG